MAKLTVIKGGLEPGPMVSGRRFISGAITATRLMGVIGMELIWETSAEGGRKVRMHQVYYLDAEEYGFESMICSIGSNDDEAVKERNRLVSSLGGAMTPISEKEARFILQTYVSISRKYSDPLPDGRENYGFLLEPVQELSRSEYFDLMSRACGPLTSPNFAINYFMMRAVSCDERGIACLCGRPEDFPDVIPPDRPAATFPFAQFGFRDPAVLCRNTIEPVSDRPGAFMCESLLETDSSYRILTTEITLTSGPFRITDARRISDFRISCAEASMLMNRSEFVTVYDIPDMSDAFLEAFRSHVDDFTETQYENGSLFINFNSDNDHAGLSEYRINDDIHVMYFLTLSNQLLLIGYSESVLRETELLVNVRFEPYRIYLSMKYEFRDPIIYEFMQSDFDDFESFIEYISDGPEE